MRRCGGISDECENGIPKDGSESVRKVGGGTVGVIVLGALAAFSVVMAVLTAGSEPRFAPANAEPLAPGCRGIEGKSNAGRNISIRVAGPDLEAAAGWLELQMEATESPCYAVQRRPGSRQWQVEANQALLDLLEQLDVSDWSIWAVSENYESELVALRAAVGGERGHVEIWLTEEYGLFASLWVAVAVTAFCLALMLGVVSARLWTEHRKTRDGVAG